MLPLSIYDEALVPQITSLTFNVLKVINDVSRFILFLDLQ